MNFGDLRTKVAAYLGRTPDPVVIQMATAAINRDLRVMEMESTTSLTGAEVIALPTNFLEAKSVYYDGVTRRELTPTSREIATRLYYPSGGTPQAFVIEGGNLILAPAPAQTGTVELRYYARLADFTADSDTNLVLQRYPGAYVYGSLFHHSQLIRDPQAAADWGAAYRGEITLANASDTRRQTEGGSVVARVGWAP